MLKKLALFWTHKHWHRIKKGRRKGGSPWKKWQRNMEAEMKKTHLQRKCRHGTTQESVESFHQWPMLPGSKITWVRRSTHRLLSHVFLPSSPSWMRMISRSLCYTSTGHSSPRSPCLLPRSSQSWWMRNPCCCQCPGRAWSETISKTSDFTMFPTQDFRKEIIYWTHTFQGWTVQLIQVYAR